ncbi:MAG TPA: erythromycin esterase family protein, partial [Thermoanaerobaculia bacterium]|nr:erythromycin esterase family protein [Thermoanaerobaculia bacterium]
LSIGIIGLLAPLPAAARPPGEVERGVWRLDGIDPDLPLDDLAPLRPILEGAHVVGLGEKIHTSGGYYTMKHRLFRFLVEEMGFRAFAIESPWAPASAVGQYVATCQGAPETVVQNLFGVWRSQEVADLARWMCAWNQAHPGDPVTFFGFDIQQPNADGPALLQFLTDQGLAADDPVLAGLRQCDGVAAPSQRGRVTLESHEACHQALDAAETILDAIDPGNPVQAPIQTPIQPSREAAEWAKVHHIGLRAWQDQAFYDGRDFPRSWNARDRGMATVFQRVRELLVGEAKTAIWAHNSHLATTSALGSPLVPTGVHLRAELGHQYAAIALVSAGVTVGGPGIGCGARPTYPESVEWHLSALGETALLVDLDASGASQSHPPYLDPEEPRLVGYSWYLPGTAYDALVYIEQSPAMTPLPGFRFCP